MNISHLTYPIIIEKLEHTSSISHTLYLPDSILRRLYSDSDLVSKHIAKEKAVFPMCKKIYRTTAGSQKTCFQQQQN